MILPEYKIKLEAIEHQMELLKAECFVADKEVTKLVKWGEALFKPGAEDSPGHLADLVQFIHDSKIIKDKAERARKDSAELMKQCDTLLEANEATVEAMLLTGTPLPKEGV